MERHRFLRAVCSCHSASEEEVLLPAARRLCPDKETAQRLSLQVWARTLPRLCCVNPWALGLCRLGPVAF